MSRRHEPATSRAMESEAPLWGAIHAYASGRCSAGLLARQTGTGNGGKGKHYRGRVRADAGGDVR